MKNQYHAKPNHLFGDGVSPGAIQIAIDWDPTALHLRYQSTRERVSLYHIMQINHFDISIHFC